MKRGIKINFTENGPTILTGEAVEDNDAMLQNIGINVATSKGTDRIFAERGTDLLSSMLKYGYVSDTYAQHQANFAAIDTKVFFRATRPSSVPEISSITMKTSRAPNNRVLLSTKVSFGTNLPLNTTVTL